MKRLSDLFYWDRKRASEAVREAQMILFTEQTLGGTSADQHGTRCSGTRTHMHAHTLGEPSVGL